MSTNLHLKLTVRLCSEDDSRIFGPGVAALLHRVETQHSLRAAAASMDMAYSKAWRIVRTAEEGLGYPLLASTTGGRHGGGAVLTQEAQQLLTAYDTLCLELESFARQRSAAVLRTPEQ